MSGTPLTLAKRKSDGENFLLIMKKLVGKLQLGLLYFFGTFFMGHEPMRNTLKIMPARVAPSDL